LKSFKQVREAKKSVKGDITFSKKIDGIPVKIVNVPKGFTVYIDGDELDTFKTQAEAEKTAKTVIKEIK